MTIRANPAQTYDWNPTADDTEPNPRAAHPGLGMLSALRHSIDLVAQRTTVAGSPLGENARRWRT